MRTAALVLKWNGFLVYVESGSNYSLECDNHADSRYTVYRHLQVKERRAG